MRELFEINQPENPMEAARRGARPILRRRFYENAAVAETPQGYALQLDGKPVHTPARRVLCAPNAAIAQKIAAEWNAQTDVIDPAKMPLTRLANAIIDGVADAPAPVAAEIEKYLGSDMLFYRAGAPNGLVERQAKYWDPILQWARDTLGAKFVLGEGVVHEADGWRRFHLRLDDLRFERREAVGADCLATESYGGCPTSPELRERLKRYWL